MTQREPGVFAGIRNEVYHSGEGVSKSGLDLIARSPLHYRFATDARNDNDDDQGETRWQRIGSLVHQLILEPASIWAEYAEPFEAPEGALRSVDDLKTALQGLGLKVSGKRDELIDRLRDADPGAVFYDDAVEKWRADVGDRRVIDLNELAQAKAMAAAVEAHPLASQLFLSSPGEAELSAYWRDAETGVLCRCRPDWWRLDGILVDVKTTEDASPAGFSKSIEKFRYHVQAAMYVDGARAALEASGNPWGLAAPHEMVFVAIEKKPPHAVAVYRLDAEAIEIGRREMRRDLATYAQCLATGVWPAYGDSLMRISLPEWRMRRELGGAA